ncbi:PKD domain-containing protein [Halobacteriales archaeon Cl-PHB]
MARAAVTDDRSGAPEQDTNMNFKQIGAVLFSVIMVTSMFVGFLAFVTLPASADEEAPLPPGDVFGPGVIEQAGTYTLQNDIDLGGQNVTAFEIKASDVVLDGNGYTIHNGASEAVHILASGSGSALSNVTVTNLKITNVETGVAMMNLQGGTFADLELVSNADAGLVVAGSLSEGNLVENSLFEDNEKGIFLRQGTSATTMRDNAFIENHEVAIKVSGSTDNEILDSYFDGQDGEKTIHLTGRSPDHVIRNNEIVNSAGPEYAVQVGGESARTVIEDNTIANNGLGGISMGPPDAVIRNNEIYGNGDPGLTVESGGHTIANNRIHDNRYGIWLLASGNDFDDNVVKNNDLWDVIAEEGATNNDVANLTIDDAGTAVSVMPAAVDFALRGATAPSPDAPEHYTAIGKYVEATTTSDSGLVDVHLHYGDGDLGSVTESDLTVALFDGSAWTGIPDTGVETANNYVYASTNSDGVLGAVAGTDDIIDPVAEAGADQTVLVNETVTFDAGTSSDNEESLSYEWGFGDGTTDSGESVTHEYDTEGTYTVTLTVTDAGGNTDTDTLAVTVLAEDTTDPVAEAGPDHYGLLNSMFEFDGSGSSDNVEIASYEWDFDDGSNATGVTASHTYTSVGHYTVTLTVTDTSGNDATDTVTVEIVESDTEAPVADAGGDRTVEVDTSVSFDGSNSTDDIGIDSYEWDFDGDGITDATGVAPTHVFTAEGDYTVTLTVADAADNTDTDVATITVAEHVDEEVLTPGDISTCGVIEEEGVYTLTRDLFASDEGVTTCFEIKASNVTLEGNGFGIYGDVPDAAEGIHVLGTTGALENVNVRNLTLSQWDSAISAKNVKDSSFVGIDYISNLDKGIAISGTDSTNNRVADSTFRDNEKGVFLERGADQTTIEHNEFDANHEVGVKASGAPDTDLLNNHFTSHDGEKAIHFTGESRRVLIQGNVVEDSTGPEYAIQLGGESGDSLIVDNVVAHNTLGGISAGPLNVTIRNNSVYDNGDIGILVGDGGAPVTENDVFENRIGLVFDASSGVDATDNVVRNNSEYDIGALDGATGNPVSGLVIDDAGTVIGLEGPSVDYAIEGDVDRPASLPGDCTIAGSYLDVDFTSEDGRLAELSMSYDYSADQTQLTLLRYDAAMDWWVGVEPTSVSGGTLSVTLEDPGVVAPATGTSDIYPPTAVATANATVVSVGETVEFDASGSTDNVGIDRYEWDFDGDGEVDSDSTTPIATFAYPANGTSVATLTVTDAAGYSDTATVEIGVDGNEPVAEAGEDVSVQPGETVTLDGSASTDDIGIASYEWDFGDDATDVGEVVTHVYADPGTYTVTLTVTDGVGNNDSDTLTVTIDGEKPTPDAGAQNRHGKVDEVLGFDASASTDNGGIASYQWTFGDGTTATGVTTSHAYDAADIYTVTLTVVDFAGNEASTDVEVTVEADTVDDGDDGGTSPPPDDDDGDEPVAGGGGGGGGGAAPPAEPSGPNVNVSYQGGNQAQVNVQNAGADSRLQVAFQFQEGQACANLEQLAFRSQAAQSFQLRVGQSAEAPEGVGSWQSRTGDPAFGYFDVDHSAQLGDGEFTFRVRTDCLGDVNPEQVRLYRHEDGEWVRLQTQLLERTENHTRYQADAPGFSTFAIGVAEADISVTGATVAPETIATGETATLDVTLRNEGDLEGSYTVEMVSDGTVLESTEATVPASEFATVSLTHQFDEAGDYTITVDGETAGTVVVESPDGAEPPDDETPAADPGADEDGGSAALLGLLGLAAVALVAAYLFYARRGDSQ